MVNNVQVIIILSFVIVAKNMKNSYSRDGQVTLVEHYNSGILFKDLFRQIFKF